MTRKNSASAAPTPARHTRRNLIVGGTAALALAGAGALLFATHGPSSSALRPELLRDDAPTLGDAGAKVHIVEFLDPACETCAAFYPIVKQMLADNPGRIRLSLRHVPLHQGSDVVVRALEAARRQDRYWQALEALFTTQTLWTEHHVVVPERALRVISMIGADMQKLQADMNDPAIAARVDTDRRDAQALGVTKTPEYFVNGRQMTSFGRQQLQALVRDELDRAY